MSDDGRKPSVDVPQPERPTSESPSATVVGEHADKLVPRQRKLDFGFLPIPVHLRYDPQKPARFGLVLNIVFGLASTFVVANLYYCQPILIPLSQFFDVTYDEVSRIPTLVQAGYGVGLLLITPLGDLVPRRPLLLGVTTICTALTIGLCTTSSFAVFEGLTFLIGLTSVAPQILMPLAADLAPPHRRATALSIVLSGLLFGVLIARVVAGFIAEFSSFRNVYFMALGVQAAVLVALYATLPDYPAKNADLTYGRILWSMAKLVVCEPTLVQASIISLASSACFTCFWVTLTFLLGGAPYEYSTLVIGLFGLVGMFGVMMAPVTGRIIDGVIPWYATLAATFGLICIQAIYTGAAGVNVAAVVIATVGLDTGRQMQQVSLTTAVFAISEKKRARLNAVLILSLFIGQVMGTSVGSKVFLEHGWRAGGALMLALTLLQLGVLLLRGPHVKRKTWFGYEGGIEWRKKVVMARRKAEAEAAARRGSNEKVDEEVREERVGDEVAVDVKEEEEGAHVDPATKV